MAPAHDFQWVDGDVGGVWEGARAVRERVFVGEQACPPEEEWDAYESTSRHLAVAAGGRTVATARWRVVDVDGVAWAKLERFAVLPEARGAGIGREIVRAALADAGTRGHRRFRLHAQAHLEGFYVSLGFAPTAHRFMEAGIPHLLMVRVVGGSEDRRAGTRPAPTADTRTHDSG